MKRAALALAVLLLPLAAHARGGRELVVAAVQLRVDARALGSPEVYERALREAVAAAVGRRRVDLIVLPEYAAAFIALAQVGDALASAATAEELLESLRAAEPSLRTPADFFTARADVTCGWIREIFGAMARERRAWIVAGTAFVPDGAGGLRNRAIVFAPDGAAAYTQDKVFLTEIEERMLAMSPGTVEAAGGFEVGGRKVRLTICRDAFEPAWESRHRGADLWIDIKANGTAFTDEERASFARALPARLGPAEVRHGLTVCLTGSLLEFVWEGESSYIVSSPNGVRTLAKTSSPSEAGSLLVAIPPRGP